MATTQEKLNFYISPAEAQLLRDLAKEQDRPISAILRQAVRRILAERYPSTPPA